jgi:hypothetical protein
MIGQPRISFEHFGDPEKAETLYRVELTRLWGNTTEVAFIRWCSVEEYQKILNQCNEPVPLLKIRNVSCFTRTSVK